MDNNRGKWNSNLMFVLAAIGSAIGMGNLWGFPYKMGANGGLPFLLIYLALVVLCGVICMGIEMAIGRKTGQSPIVARSLAAKKFKIVGWCGVLAAFIIMGFYSVLIGYAIRYFAGFLSQLLVNINGFNNAANGADFTIDFDNFTAGIDGLNHEWVERVMDEGWGVMRLDEKNNFNANFRAKAVANGDEFSLSIKADKMVLSNFKNTGTATIVDTWANKSAIFA